ncbi:MAG: hypothetical protein A2X51_10870 [Candidatus Rokubacteria bacterium GWC2_70_24]|nr:MAG: hypothetical protein A2X51_10870 [Candidatus Rokubacteria bacterium GWC2_70_24]
MKGDRIMDPLLFIVRHDQSDMFDYLSDAFGRDEHIQVILDQRLAERRQAADPPARERRRARSRRRRGIDGELRRLGLAVVRGSHAPA